MNDQKSTRRDVLRKMGLTSVSVAAVTMGAGVASGFSQQPTPDQPEGPFYPVRDQLDKNADMTWIKGHTHRAQGEVLFVHGRVIEAEHGKPLSKVLVEFWQACASGKYDHPDDPNTAPLDPDFQYWAQVLTDERGEFSIKTIIPGAYPADANWVRPPHIHIKAHALGYPSLTSQLYVAGHPLNEADQIFARLAPAQKQLVLLELKDVAGIHHANIDIVLGKRGFFGADEGRLPVTPMLE